jgi:long-chain fatty acid transport protein
MLTPIQGLRLGYCFRNSFSLVAGSNTAAIEAHILVGEKEWVLPLVPAVTFEAFYVPQQHNFGAAYWWNERLLISFDLSWFRWSDYASESRGTPDPPWQDTIIPRLGIEVRPWKALALRLGYFFEPSPVAEQNRGSNYLDNDRHAFSFGAGYTFADPLQIVREAMEVDLVVHYIHMPSRRTVKEAGFSPDFETEGEILSMGGNVTFRF